MKTLVKDYKYDQHVEFFNKNNYPNYTAETISEIKTFLLKEEYKLLSSTDTEIVLNKGSVNGALSFINYKFPLFKNVHFHYDNEGLVYITKT